MPNDRGDQQAAADEQQRPRQARADRVATGLPSWYEKPHWPVAMLRR
jgi:hypothetical protein